jgi:hypothetical protein
MTFKTSRLTKSLYVPRCSWKHLSLKEYSILARKAKHKEKSTVADDVIKS